MEALYKLRLEIDGLIQLANSTEVSNDLYSFFKSLQLAKAWMTRTIKELHPGDESSDSLSMEGEVTPITYNLIFIKEWRSKKELEKIDFFLQQIDIIVEELPDYTTWCYKHMEEQIFSKCDSMTKEEYGAFEEKACQEMPNWELEITQVYIHLTEAKMFLGFEILNLK